MDSARAVISAEVDSKDVDIARLNQGIYSNPELAFAEFHAHQTFVELLQSLGFTVTPHAYGVETAFSAEVGSGGRLVVFNAEYDALPEIGHACGHNLIASASLASFLGAAAALRSTGIPGRVRLLGTPAEENGGGKLKLIENGAYAGCSAAIMAHPVAGGRLQPPVRGVAFLRTLCNARLLVTYEGREAHAAIAPWAGVNALDAICLSYNAISMLRQHILPTERIHGVFHKSGTRPNVVPGETVVEYFVRSDTKASAFALANRVINCFRGAATATGCKVHVADIACYADLRPSPKLCRAYMNAMAEGTIAYDEPADILAGSTDMGNVSYETPSFHAGFAVDTEPGVNLHTHEFTVAAGTRGALDRAIECGKGMALIGWRVLSDDAFAHDVYEDWERDIQSVTGMNV
ncbi:unnamed protein product [Clonostachys rhizophaga]|uniref:Peptidase M20 domain-containing protein 2 n=1 Tax=Clonostachys rhizophaga TaxID=160324 RepID=A0A9N9VJW7_9HYPO|nr:unnamed protein product [Clonostachys rhizophaga]